MEIWVDVENYEGLYKVSNMGNILSLRRNKLVIGDINNAGYRRVILYKEKKRERFFVHRLVAKYFCPNYKEENVVNHLDGDKQNNKASNLEWCSRSENDIHAYNLGLRGANNSKRVAKYNLETLEIIAIYDSIVEASRENQIWASAISEVCNGKYKQWKGYGYKFI